MKKNLTCIECPKGCLLSVDIENCKVVKVAGLECAKGKKYAVSEIENPVRIVTSTVLTEGLELKMIPVRTDKPISKKSIANVMKEIKAARIKTPIKTGGTVIKNILNSGADLVATRSCKR